MLCYCTSDILQSLLTFFVFFMQDVSQKKGTEQKVQSMS
jgi:hypothetical protein